MLKTEYFAYSSGQWGGCNPPSLFWLRYWAFITYFELHYWQNLSTLVELEHDYEQNTGISQSSVLRLCGQAMMSAQKQAAFTSLIVLPPVIKAKSFWPGGF